MPTKPKIRAVRALEAIEPPRPVVTRLSEADEAVDKFGPRPSGSATNPSSSWAKDRTGTDR